MAYNANDTDVMRTSAGVFKTTSNSFTDESSDITATLSDILSALETVVGKFNRHNVNVAQYASDVSGATEQMEAVWQSGAATAFQDSFTQFNKLMVDLSQKLQDISNAFNKVKQDIDEIVNNDVLKQVETYASNCSIDSENLKNYADTEDENNQKFASAYGG